MLMISRRLGERIVIGNDIEITITEIHRRTVRLAVKSTSQQVLRGEVRDAIEAANRAAAATCLDEEGLVALATKAATASASEPVRSDGAPPQGAAANPAGGR